MILIDFLSGVNDFRMMLNDFLLVFNDFLMILIIISMFYDCHWNNIFHMSLWLSLILFDVH